MLKTAMQKEALTAAATNFGRGLIAPAMKFSGGLRRAFGYGQQALSGLTGSKSLFRQGTKNIVKGRALRNTYGLNNMMRQGPWSQRIGRGIGAGTLGYGLFNLPVTAAEQLGAASIDPEVAKGHGMAMAQDRIAARMNQFKNLSFSDRMQAAHNPEMYAQQILETSPQFLDLATYNKNPGFSDYFAPYALGMLSPSAFNPIKNKINFAASTLDGLNKQGSVKQANKLVSIVPSAVSNFYSKVIRPAWQLGRNKALSGKFVGPPSIDPRVAKRQLMRSLNSPAQRAIAKTVSNFAAAPGKNLGLLGGIGFTVAGVPYSYYAGKKQVFDQAGSAAEGMADLQFAQQFAGANPFMRYGAALMPGLASNLVNAKVTNMMAPHSDFYANQVYSQPYNPYSSANMGNSYGAPSYQLGNQ